MNQLILKKEAFAVRQYLSRELFNDPHVEITEFLGREINLIVRDKFFTKHAGTYTYTYPATWWDHLKKEKRWLRNIFGEPKYKRTRVGVKCVLEPSSYKFRTDTNTNEIITVMDSIDWYANFDEYSDPMTVEMSEMKFWPSFYTMEEPVEEYKYKPIKRKADWSKAQMLFN